MNRVKRYVCLLIMIGLILGITIITKANNTLEIKGIDKKEVVNAAVKTMVDAGFNVTSVNEYQVSFSAMANSFNMMFLYGSKFNGTPEVRINLNFVQINDNVTITGTANVITNPQSAFEKSNPVDANQLTPIFNAIKEKFYGSVRFGIQFSNNGKKNGCYEVIRVWKNSSVEKAGIEVGDLIKEVNGKPTSKMSLKKFDSCFVAPDETELNLTIINKSGEEKQVVIRKTFIPGEYQYLFKENK